MSDLYLLGGSGQIIQPDAVERYASGMEADTILLFRSKSYAPYGVGADVVFRRVAITARYRSTIALRVTPIVDGRRIPDAIAYLARGAGAERYVWTVPLGTQSPTYGAQALRGSTIQFEIEVTAPEASWHLEPLELFWRPALHSRRSG